MIGTHLLAYAVIRALLQTRYEGEDEERRQQIRKDAREVLMQGNMLSSLELAEAIVDLYRGDKR